MNNKIIIFGTGEIASLAYFYFSNDSNYKVVGFTADDQFIKEDHFCDLPLIPLSDLRKSFPPDSFMAHVALSYNKLNQIREQKYFLMKKIGYKLVNYICSKSIMWSDLSVGDNCFILENQTIQPGVKIGNNVMIWSGNHIGHGTIIDDHTYLSSHICISGHTKIGKRCFIGVNSTFKDFSEVGNDVFITMGVKVAKKVSDGSIVLSNSSSIFDSDHNLSKKLKKKYFNL